MRTPVLSDPDHSQFLKTDAEVASRTTVVAGMLWVLVATTGPATPNNRHRHMHTHQMRGGVCVESRDIAPPLSSSGRD